MPVHISATHLAKLRKQSEGLMRRASGLKDKAESAVKVMVGAAEVGGASFALGIAKGRYGSIHVVGVPADLGAALVLHGLAFVKIAGKSSHHLHAFGNGALASYMTTLGQGVGMDMKKKALGAAVKGDTGHRLTEAELAALAR